MITTRKWNEWIRDLSVDIRLEVILADLLDNGKSMDDIVIASNSLFKRNYHRDIENAEERTHASSRKTRLHISVNRDGLYDLLPEDLFHQPGGLRGDEAKEGEGGEMKVQAAIEKASRLFFLPYEQEFYRQKVRLEKEEQAFLFETNSDLSADLLTGLWHLPEFLDARQKSKLGVLMPVLNQVAGDWPLVGIVMESLTGNRVDIRETVPVGHLLPPAATLGDVRLGLDSLLGGQRRATQLSITVAIHLNGNEQLTGYMPGGQLIRTVEFLTGLLMPLETDPVYEICFAERISFELEENNPYHGRLSYTTVI